MNAEQIADEAMKLWIEAEDACAQHPMSSDGDQAAAAVIAAKLAEKDAEIARLKDALVDLISWFPEQEPEPEYRIRAGELGASGAVEAARQALKPERPDHD